MTVFTSRRPEADVAAELTGTRGPLAGVRLAVKDNVDVAGLPTMAGCPEFAHLPDRDAPAVAALRAAGAVVVGKTNLDQIADSRRPDFIGGEPRSGSAIAVATGDADIALGTETASSVRIPAGLQAIVGIKPTAGVVSTYGVLACESHTCLTIFAREVELANRTMGVIAGAAHDRVWPADVRLAARPDPVVAVPDELTQLDPKRRAAFEAAVASLQDGGASVVAVDIDPFLAAAKLLHDGALVSERYVAVSELIDAHPNASLDPTVRRIIAETPDIPAHRLVRDRREVNRLRDLARNALDGVDVLVVPTASMRPSLDEAQTDAVCDLFDLCAVAVPAGMAGPDQFGITVLARAFDDAVALDIAALVSGVQAPVEVWPLAAADSAELVVFGAHLRGGPLAHQLTDLGARWAGEVTTAPHYRMSVLPTTPPKPAVTRAADGTPGRALSGHRWLLSPAALGHFLAALPAPMQLGKVEFDDGTWRTAFGCDAAAATGADISAYGSWPAAIAAGAAG